MRSIIRATVIALGLSATAGVVQAQQPVKIAYVNTAALMEFAPGKAAADSQLTKMAEGLRKDFQKLQDSAQALLTKYQKDEAKMTAAAKDKAQKDLQGLETDLQAKQLQFQQQLAQKQQELMAPITDAVKKVLDDIREEGGYAMILANDPQTTTIVAADKNLDITDKVVSRLKATPAVKAKAADAQKGAPTSPAGVTRPKPPTQ
jgi:outer membrane protein